MNRWLLAAIAAQQNKKVIFDGSKSENVNLGYAFMKRLYDSEDGGEWAPIIDPSAVTYFTDTAIYNIRLIKIEDMNSRGNLLQFTTPIDTNKYHAIDLIQIQHVIIQALDIFI